MNKPITSEKLNKHLPLEYQSLVEWKVDGSLVEEKETIQNFSLFCKKDKVKILSWTFDLELTNKIVDQALKNCHE